MRFCIPPKLRQTIAAKGSSERPISYSSWLTIWVTATSVAIRLGNWKGVIHPLEPHSPELYDLRTDLREKRNVAASNPEVVKQILEIAHSAHVPSELWHFGKARTAAQARPKKS